MARDELIKQGHQTPVFSPDFFVPPSSAPSSSTLPSHSDIQSSSDHPPSSDDVPSWAQSLSADVRGLQNSLNDMMEHMSAGIRLLDSTFFQQHYYILSRITEDPAFVGAVAPVYEPERFDWLPLGRRDIHPSPSLSADVRGLQSSLNDMMEHTYAGMRFLYTTSFQQHYYILSRIPGEPAFAGAVAPTYEHERFDWPPHGRRDAHPLPSSRVFLPSTAPAGGEDTVAGADSDDADKMSDS